MLRKSEMGSRVREPRRVHDMIGGRIEPAQVRRIWEMRLKATHWVDGIEVGDWIRWNPAHDVESLATFQVLSSYTPRGCNMVYKVDLGRVLPEIWVAGVHYRPPQPGHLVVVEDDPLKPKWP